MERKTKHLVVLSLDAMGSSDFTVLSELPNTKELLGAGSFCKNVQSMYPSLTYPCHTSMITGCTPRKHGIINNTKKQFFRKSPDWYWYQKDVKVPSLIDVALDSDMKLASLFWPVTGGSKIQYNMAEILSKRKWQNHFLGSLY